MSSYRDSEMELVASTLWNEPRIMETLLRNSFVLDPTVFIGNPQVYYFKKKKDLICFVALKRHGKAYELKSVYTFPRYRKKRHMRRLINQVLKLFPAPYLICKPRLVSFYTRFGFQKTNRAPPFLQFEKRCANWFIPRKKHQLVLMKRVIP